MKLNSGLLLETLLVLISSIGVSAGKVKINRKDVVSRFNPTRDASSNTTPMQVGNGDFAFGADVTGLQTFVPYATLSSWGWHNFSLPTTPGQTSPSDFTGLDWWTHGRLVNYEQPNSAEQEISDWMTANPHRINLGRIGLHFPGEPNITESDLSDKLQTLDLYTGQITSSFQFNGTSVTVSTSVDPGSDTVSITVESALLSQGQLGLFFDYPYATKTDFEAPLMGDWDSVSAHRTELSWNEGDNKAQISHVLDDTTYYTSLRWKNTAKMTTVMGTHRYILQPQHPTRGKFDIAVNFSPTGNAQAPSDVETINRASSRWWKDYWKTGAFIDLTATENTTAVELQRRIVLSQYLLAVNEAGYDPPQESGLVNNGWYGKFHLEMYLWHSLHWIPWGRSSLLERSIDVYNRFLPTSIERAQKQGYLGARLGKMSDPSGRSAPGEINSLLIWQQPHVFYFAELEYKSVASSGSRQRHVLNKWENILTQAADFMASYAFWNQSTGVYDLGPPMYEAAELTPPNSTINPTFETAYWRFGLEKAILWKERLRKPVPDSWQTVLDHLAPLPTIEVELSGSDRTTETITTYTIYEGIPNMWTDPETIRGHPTFIGSYGLLPATSAINLTIIASTMAEINSVWNFAQCWGWDFPMLSMTATRLGNVDDAVRYLVDKNFQFDDAGMPVGTLAPTPYFPSSSSLLLAVAMMAGGWDSETQSTTDDRATPGFPVGWDVRAEGFMEML